MEDQKATIRLSKNVRMFYGILNCFNTTKLKKLLKCTEFQVIIKHFLTEGDYENISKAEGYESDHLVSLNSGRDAIINEMSTQ